MLAQSSIMRKQRCATVRRYANKHNTLAALFWLQAKALGQMLFEHYESKEWDDSDSNSDSATDISVHSELQEASTVPV
jgi:hypothetical protein